MGEGSTTPSGQETRRNFGGRTRLTRNDDPANWGGGGGEEMDGWDQSKPNLLDVFPWGRDDLVCSFMMMGQGVYHGVG